MKVWRRFWWFVAACAGWTACSSNGQRTIDEMSTDSEAAAAARIDQIDQRLKVALNRPADQRSWVPVTRHHLNPEAFKTTHRETTRDKISLAAQTTGFYVQTIDESGDQYVRISMDATGLGGDVGSPALPFKGIYLEVPYGVSLDAEVVSSNTTATVLSKPVHPKQRPPIESLDVVPVFEKNMDVYQQDQLLPEKIVDIKMDGLIRGRRIIFLEIHPVQYNPVTGELQVHSDIVINVNLIGSWNADEERERALEEAREDVQHWCD